MKLDICVVIRVSREKGLELEPKPSRPTLDEKRDIEPVGICNDPSELEAAFCEELREFLDGKFRSSLEELHQLYGGRLQVSFSDENPFPKIEDSNGRAANLLPILGKLIPLLYKEMERAEKAILWSSLVCDFFKYQPFVPSSVWESKSNHAIMGPGLTVNIDDAPEYGSRLRKATLNALILPRINQMAELVLRVFEDLKEIKSYDLGSILRISLDEWPSRWTEELLRRSD